MFTGTSFLGKIDDYLSDGHDTDSHAYHCNNSRNDYSRNHTSSCRADVYSLVNHGFGHDPIKTKEEILYIIDNLVLIEEQILIN